MDSSLSANFDVIKAEEIKEELNVDETVEKTEFGIGKEEEDDVNSIDSFKSSDFTFNYVELHISCLI